MLWLTETLILATMSEGYAMVHSNLQAIFEWLVHLLLCITIRNNTIAHEFQNQIARHRDVQKATMHPYCTIMVLIVITATFDRGIATLPDPVLFRP